MASPSHSQEILEDFLSFLQGLPSSFWTRLQPKRVPLDRSPWFSKLKPERLKKIWDETEHAPKNRFDIRGPALYLASDPAICKTESNGDENTTALLECRLAPLRLFDIRHTLTSTLRALHYPDEGRELLKAFHDRDPSLYPLTQEFAQTLANHGFHGIAYNPIRPSAGQSGSCLVTYEEPVKMILHTDAKKMGLKPQNLDPKILVRSSPFPSTFLPNPS